MAVVLAAACVTGLRMAKLLETDLRVVAAKPRNVDAEAAEGLRALGIREGDRLSIIAPMSEVHWARQAGATIASEIPLGEEAKFWTASEETKRRVFQTLAGTGAKLVVVEEPPLGASREGWKALGSGYYAHPL